MYIDIVSLVRNALLESGCDESLLGDFDAHSTISLDFDNYPSMLISITDDNVWIWSKLCEANDAILRHKAPVLLEKMMSGCLFCMAGQLQMQVSEGYIELRGLVHPDYLESSKGLADAMDEFFAQQEEFLSLIR